tara:strand:- start:872 stop:1267 length:396 start_codon:yes stop_codon:yes gene_type:complete
MNVAVGDTLPEQFHTPDNVQLMFYNAALWNGHRIHFDEPYAKEVEGYPGLVIAGPLLGDWLNQVVELWLGESGRLTKIEYSNRVASYIGETLTAGGNVTAIEGNTITIEVFIKNEDGDVIAPGVATAEIIA